MMTKTEADVFTSKWLPVWTGNNPERLADFYSDDAFYSDHLVPEGASGKVEILAHFRKILGQNPCWVWRATENIPLDGGFLCKWRAEIPVGEKTINCLGV